MDSEIGKIYELFDCSVCLDKLDRFNKVLPCQHTFCKKCLDKMISFNGEIRCPECRARYRGKVEDLPSNILLIRILDKFDKMKNKSHPLPVETKENSVTPSPTNESEEFFQANIYASHQRQPSSRPVLKAIRKLTHADTTICTSGNASRLKLKAFRRIQ